MPFKLQLLELYLFPLSLFLYSYDLRGRFESLYWCQSRLRIVEGTARACASHDVPLSTQFVASTLFVMQKLLYKPNIAAHFRKQAPLYTLLPYLSILLCACSSYHLSDNNFFDEALQDELWISQRVTREAEINDWKKNTIYCQLICVFQHVLMFQELILILRILKSKNP